MDTTAHRPAGARYRFTLDQYLRMAELGFYEGKRVEFIGGDVIAKAALSNERYAKIDEIRDVLTGVFGRAFWVRAQATLDLSPHGSPDPDIAVVAGGRTPLRKENPTSAVLIVDVSDSRLAYDRTTKASLYAAAGVPEYWMVNVPDRVLEVRRDPRPDATAEFGAAYGSLATLAPGAAVAPLARPDAAVPVERLFVA